MLRSWGEGETKSQRAQVSVMQDECLRELLYSAVSIVNNTKVILKNLLRVDLMSNILITINQSINRTGRNLWKLWICLWHRLW